jgi:hypothetical protein
MGYLSQHQRIYIKVDLPVYNDELFCHNDNNRNKNNNKRKNDQESASFEGNNKLWRSELKRHPTFTAQRKHLNEKVCRLAREQYLHEHPDFDDGCGSTQGCGYALAQPIQPQISDSHSSSKAHVVCQKTLHDAKANRKNCCTGAAGGVQCPNKWGPADPFGKCLSFVKSDCCGRANSCARQKFLSDVKRNGQSIKDFFCQYWYSANVDAYIPKSNHIPSSTADKQKKMDTAYQIIMDFCSTFPETGECSCLKAFDLCACQTNHHNCGVYGDPKSHYGRRFTMYKYHVKKPGGKNKKPTYHFGKLIPGKNGNLHTVPVHCWSRACQFSTSCGFLPQKALEKKCPDICMQFSSSTVESLKNVTGYKEIAVDSYTLTCPQSADGSTPANVSKKVHALEFDTGHVKDNVAPNTWVEELRFTLKLRNVSCDKDSSDGNKRYFCISSSAPKVAYAEQRNGCLKTGQSIQVPVRVNTAGLSEGQHWVQFLVEDTCGGSKPFSCLYMVNVFAQPPCNIPPCATK